MYNISPIYLLTRTNLVIASLERINETRNTRKQTPILSIDKNFLKIYLAISLGVKRLIAVKTRG